MSRTMEGLADSLPEVIRKGKTVTIVEELIGKGIHEIVRDWITEELPLKQGSDRICNLGRIYNRPDRRGVYRMFQRYVKLNCNDDQKTVLLPTENGKKYSTLLADYLGVPRESVIDFIVDSKMQVMDVVRKVYGDEQSEVRSKLYYFIYAKIGLQYGRNVAKSLCSGTVVSRNSFTMIESTPVPSINFYANVRPQDVY